MKALQLKISLFTFLFFTFISISYAQEKSPAHLGLFYPISTHGTEAVHFTNNFSLHLLTGLSGGENGAAIYGLAGMVKGDVRGAQISGLWNNVSGNVTGIQVAGILNQSSDANKSAQIGGISNINLGNSALQVAGIFNTAKAVEGAQIAGIADIADTIDGIQVSGIASMSKSVKGAQIAGIANISPEIDGAQIAGISNLAREVKGVQIAGISNIAENVEGTQIAGLVNRAKTVKGMQIGLINIADSSDVTIGLINIVKIGDQRLGVSIDENLNSFLTFRSGGKYVYGIFGVGTNLEVKELKYGFQAGLGLNLAESNHFRLDVEAVSKYLTDFDGNNFSKFSFQLLPTLKITQSIHLFAGPSISYMYSRDLNILDHTGLTIWDETHRENYQAVLLGFTGGVNVRL
ncbi:hypothetical protein [Algoriphagus aquimarinus]|uniref:Uncharacterized protein n=1 Tax=Algoriphagus aquimarinus TaxID=237018 RepID=A0A1I1AIX6_9BACT|nr:hypothetical protein [Algoriphagus aquimarinus]SFB37887.1 hypothetical protein SAMN04489723_108165 [Algoriphagus aquimarinus]